MKVFVLLAATNVCDEEIKYASCGLLRYFVIAFVCPVEMSRVIFLVTIWQQASRTTIENTRVLVLKMI